MKRFLTILATLALCACIAVVPCFAIQSGYYEGQTMVHLLGGQYQVELMGVGDDAIVLFDTRDMYWYSEDGTLVNSFETHSSSLNNPVVNVHNEITTDEEASLVYNDLALYIEDDDFPTADTIATTFMTSDRFTLNDAISETARLALHLNPIFNLDTNEHIVPVGTQVQGQITIYGINQFGEIFEQTIGRDDLVVGATFDIEERIRTFNATILAGIPQYYWIEYEGEGVIPSFVQDIHFELGMPFSDVRVVDFATDITYPEYVDYKDFNLLEWISTAVDGFMRAPLFVLGDFTVTLGAILAVGIAVPIFVAFLRRYAGG